MQEMQETQVRSLDWEDPLEEGTATYSSILAWRIPWTEGFGGLQSIEPQKLDMNEVTEHTCTCTRYNLRNIGLKDKEL